MHQAIAQQTSGYGAEGMRSGLILVDGYENRLMQGRFWYPCFPAPRPFLGLMDLLLQMEETLELIRFPGAYCARRSFFEPRDNDGRACSAPYPVPGQKGGCATFRIRVIYRQNASWQGLLTWVDGQREEPFRSVLELVELMDSALTAANPTVQKRTTNASSL